ncbi:MAG: hypothetical protein CSA74_09880 [Rhodobacterales bacterium]|nr:MAG: hypothetical protein CSA74_09880 [Rhodobacterales bacterium]
METNTMKLTPTLAALSLIALATPALAGNLAPAPEPHALGLLTPPAPDWSGFYVGATGMKANGSYDGIYPFTGNPFPGDGEGDLDGTGYGLLLGWNGQSGQMVYGAELSYQKTDITGVELCHNINWNCGVDIDSVAALRGRLGWLATDRTLIYGTAGIARAEVTGYTESSSGTVYPDEKTQNGYVFGLGLEQKITDRINLRGALMRYDFAGEDYTVDFGMVVDDLKTDFTALELGVTFKF